MVRASLESLLANFPESLFLQTPMLMAIYRKAIWIFSQACPFFSHITVTILGEPCKKKGGPRGVSQNLKISEQGMMCRGWCTGDDALRVMHQDVMHQEVMHWGWCTRRWCRPDQTRESLVLNNKPHQIWHINIELCFHQKKVKDFWPPPTHSFGVSPKKWQFGHPLNSSDK